MVDLTQSEPVGVVTTAEDRAHIRRLMLFFGMVYVVEGIGQTGGIISQPLNYYLKEVHAWTPVQVTAFLAVFMLKAVFFVKSSIDVGNRVVPPCVW